MAIGRSTGGAVLDCTSTQSLNTVRAELVERSEQWEHSSAYCRHLGLDDWLMPLKGPTAKPYSSESKGKPGFPQPDRAALSPSLPPGLIPRQLPRIAFQALVQYSNRSGTWSPNVRFSWLQATNAGLFVV